MLDTARARCRSHAGRGVMSDVRLASAEGHERGRVCLAPLAEIGGHVAAVHSCRTAESVNGERWRGSGRCVDVWVLPVRTVPNAGGRTIGWL
jgi:hypothetical protein